MCIDWVFDATAFAAWGTWAAVVVALGIALSSSISRYRQRRIEARLLAAMLFHEVSHTHAILETIHLRVMPEHAVEIAEAFIASDADVRKEIASHIARIQLPALARAADRLSVMPTEAAIVMGELHTYLAFLAQAGNSLATGDEPPAAFYPELRANVATCLGSATEARQMLRKIGFPKGWPTSYELGTSPNP